MCVSEYIDSHAPTDDEKAIGVENVSAQTLLINDLNINEHPLLKLNRYEPLMKHLESHRKIGPHLGAYLAVMGYEKIGDYLQSFTNLYIKPNHKTKEGIGCHYKVDSNDEIILQRLKVLSTRHLDQTKSAFDIVEIKRSPFFKLSFSDTDFVLLDNQILIDKIYDVFIEEFYFSYLRDKGMRIDEYKGAVGEAFQEYIATILRRTLARRYMTFKALDELKVGIPEVELADIYFRQNKKVLLGEIKVTKLTARQFQGNIDDLFFEGREKFYSRFGLEQLAESVRKFCESPQLFEVGNTAKAYTIYPVLILSERSFQTPLMPEMCKLRFLELLTQMNLAPHRVIPLSVMHTSDVELIDENLTKGSIWRIFEGTYKKLTFSRHVCEVLGQMKVRPKFRLDFYKLLQNSQR